MSFTKIEEKDLTNKGVTGLPDTPGLSTTEMQQKFDELARDVIVPKFNNLVDELDEKDIDHRIKSEAITDLRLNEKNAIEASTNHGKSWQLTSSEGHKIVDNNGTVFSQRAKLKFTGATEVSDNEENDTTVVTVAKGEKGEKGDKGDAATITIGSVESGEECAVTNSGSETDAIFNFVLQRGEKGTAATVRVGTVQSGQSASVTNRGTTEEAVFDFILPKGDKGDTGQGINILGEYESYQALKSARPSGSAGQAYMVGLTNPKDLYIWNPATRDWVSEGQLQGVKGDKGDTATIAIGTVESGSTPSVENVGTSTDAIFNFVLEKGERGEKGDFGAVAIGNVTSGETASVKNVGTPTDAILDFVIPKGEKGDPMMVNGKSGSSIVLDGTDIPITPNSSVMVADLLGATINVSYTDDLIGATIICTNGTDTLTQTATPSLKVVFKVGIMGEWTLKENIQETEKKVEVERGNSYSLTVGGDRFINVTYEDAFIGKNIVCSNGVKTITKKATSSGSVMFAVTEDGSYEISCTIESQEFKRNVAVSGEGTYSTFLATADRFINVTCDPEFEGKDATCTNGNVTQTKTIANNYVAFGFLEDGNYTITVTLEGKNYTASVNVSGEGNYDVNLRYSAGFDYAEWLTEGGITKSFSSLEGVLADEPTVRQLMTKHASVDYLVSNCDSANAETIFNAFNVMKWVNLRDYALDKLSEVAEIKAVMDSVGMYGYGEVTKDSDGNVILKGCVPIMTSNTAPYGEASASSAQSTYQAWQAFDGNDSTPWNSNTTTAWVQYKFTNPVCVKAISCYVNSNNQTVNIQGSNDGTAWETIIEDFSLIAKTKEFKTSTNNEYFLYYRANVTASIGTAWLHTLQFYGRELKVSVPKMTSNTAPWGEAITDVLLNPYKAFDAPTLADSSTYANISGSTTPIGSYIGYNFNKSVCVKFAMIKQESGKYSFSKYRIVGSNDKVTWTDLTGDITGNTTRAIDIVSFNNLSGYKYYAVKCTEAYSGYNAIIYGINFYGFDYSEKEFAEGSNVKYLYDHGVELSELEVYNDANGLSAKESDFLYISKKGTANTLSRINTISKIDLTSKKLLKVVADKKWSISNGGTFRIACTNAKSTLSTYQGTASLDLYGNSDLPNNINLNISSVNESDYIEFQAMNVSGTYTGHYSIAEAWLE